MKQRFLAILLAVMFLSSLISCEQGSSQVSDISSYQSQETSEDASVESSEISDEKKVWTEVSEEANENTKTTTEYRDGKRDYSVTVEKFSIDGTLANKHIQTYVNELLTYDEKVEYAKDETVVERVVTQFDDNGKKTNGERYFVTESIIQNAKYQYDNKENIASGNVEYTAPDGKLLASGTLSHELIEVYKCCVERLTVYDEEGQLSHKETYAYLHGKVDYVYSDASFSGEDISITIETLADGTIRIFIYDDVKARLYMYGDGICDLIDMHESRVVAQFLRDVNYDMMVTTMIGYGKLYTLEAAEERLTEVLASLYYFRAIMFTEKLNESFHLQNQKVD